jgi:hypothetical protein
MPVLVPAASFPADVLRIGRRHAVGRSLCAADAVPEPFHREWNQPLHGRGDLRVDVALASDHANSLRNWWGGIDELASFGARFHPITCFHVIPFVQGRVNRRSSTRVRMASQLVASVRREVNHRQQCRSITRIPPLRAASPIPCGTSGMGLRIAPVRCRFLSRLVR